MGWASVIGSLLEGLVKLLGMAAVYFAGKREAEVAQLKQDREVMEQADRIRDRLRRDPDYRERVRRRFRIDG